MKLLSLILMYFFMPTYAIANERDMDWYVANAECIAMNIYHEARGESEQGQLAVGMVTMNRAKADGFPRRINGKIATRKQRLSGTPCQIVYDAITQHNQPVINKCQFSWYCDGRMDTPDDTSAYISAVKIAVDVLFNYDDIDDVTGGALFYHAKRVDPSWNKGKIVTTVIDKHIFYLK